MDAMLWVVFAMSCLGISFTPGPNSLLVINHSVRFGPIMTINTILGGVIGFVIMMAISIFFLNTIVSYYPDALTYVKYAGSLYLLYLGYGLLKINKKANKKEATASIKNEGEATRVSLFFKGMISASANPKVIIFFSAFLAPFINPDKSLAVQFIILAATFAISEFLIEFTLSMTANKFGEILRLHEDRFSKVCGVFFVLLGLILAFS